MAILNQAFHAPTRFLCIKSEKLDLYSLAKLRRIVNTMLVATFFDSRRGVSFGLFDPSEGIVFEFNKRVSESASECLKQTKDTILIGEHIFFRKSFFLFTPACGLKY
mmetsp:Transcript_6485/g.12204  ORF Transcript_6485/g.12204 Transcript_6485/m.12204 type:complete len:107 (-) Transcript_6485:346-666(-)